MQTGITLRQVCDYFRIDLELVRDFAEFGLYPTVLFEGEIGIETQNLHKLKKVISLHQALGINKEGIEAILNLGEQVAGLQKEVGLLQNEVEKLKRQAGIAEPEVLKRLGLLIEISD
jgi:chaperone modulatory protein CbpM